MAEDLMNQYSQEIQCIRMIEDPETGIVENYYRRIASFSHILGCMTSILVDYLRSAFNDKFFKTIWNSMEVMYSQRSKAFLDTLSKPRPILIIDPKFDPVDPAMFRSQSDFDQYVANEPTHITKTGASGRWSKEVSKYNNYILYCYPRRYRITYNLHFIFDSDMQRLQCQEYIRQVIRHRYPNPVYRFVEMNIPDEYMMEIARMNNFDWKSNEFLHFLNSLSSLPITRRFRGGSGNVEFFWMARMPIVIHFPDYPSSNGPVRRGNIDISSSFSENCTLDFTAPALFYLITRFNKGDPLKSSVIKPIYLKPPEEQTEMASVGTNYLYVNEYPDIPKFDINNNQLITSVTLQADKNGDDTIKIFDINNDPDIYAMYKYFKDNKLPIDFLSVTVFENVTPLDSTRFTVDYENMEITIKDMDIYRTYYVNIYVNNKRLSSINLKDFETDKYYTYFRKDETNG